VPYSVLRARPATRRAEARRAGSERRGERVVPLPAGANRRKTRALCVLTDLTALAIRTSLTPIGVAVSHTPPCKGLDSLVTRKAKLAAPGRVESSTRRCRVASSQGADLRVRVRGPAGGGRERFEEMMAAAAAAPACQNCGEARTRRLFNSVRPPGDSREARRRAPGRNRGALLSREEEP